MSVEPPETEAEMKELVRSGHTVESEAEMTEGYKEALKTLLTIQLDNELVTHYAITRTWDTPNMRARLGLNSVLKDELAHTHIVSRMLADLGEDPEELIYNREPHEYRNNYGVEFAANDFVEKAVVIGFLDRGGSIILEDIHENCSYGPYRRSLKRVLTDQAFHKRWGFTWLKKYANESEESRERVQEAVDKWFPLGIEWFGTPDDYSNSEMMIEYRLQSKTSDGYREEWLQQVVPFLEDIDIDVPAHTTEDGDVELEFDWPVAVDIDTLEWDYDQPVTWDDVLDRWRRGGPLMENFPQEIQQRRAAAGVV